MLRKRKEKLHKNYSLPQKLLKKIVKSVKQYIIAFVIIASASTAIVCEITYKAMAQDNIAYATASKDQLNYGAMHARHLKSKISLLNDSIENIRMDLVEDVYRYMTKYSSNPKISAEHIVDECIRTNFDIPLLLSQARLESVFGQRTGGSKSCFGVISRRYKTYDESVTDYINIMQKSYLSRSTPEQLIARGFYVEGSRKYKYASDPNYSKTISGFRTNIIKKTDIVPLYNQLCSLQLKRDSLQKELDLATV